MYCQSPWCFTTLGPPPTLALPSPRSTTTKDFLPPLLPTRHVHPPTKFGYMVIDAYCEGPYSDGDPDWTPKLTPPSVAQVGIEPKSRRRQSLNYELKRSVACGPDTLTQHEMKLKTKASRIPQPPDPPPHTPTPPPHAVKILSDALTTSSARQKIPDEYCDHGLGVARASSLGTLSVTSVNGNSRK